MCQPQVELRLSVRGQPLSGTSCPKGVLPLPPKPHLQLGSRVLMCPREAASALSPPSLLFPALHTLAQLHPA